MIGKFGVLAGALSLAQIPTALVYSGAPPVRYMGAASAFVSYGTVSRCGEPLPGHHFLACVRGGVTHLPNPCDYPNEKFAGLSCHEKAHTLGWPGTHGE